jgi:uracil-DNA glycosylase
MYLPSKPLAHYSGAKTPKILLVGEAWGREEAEIARPFVGSSGKLLFEMLGEANAELEPELHREIVESHRFGNSWVFIRDQWLEAASIGFTNVFNFQPLANKIESISWSKKELKAQGHKDYDWPHLKTGCFLDPMYLPELDRLQEEVRILKPNLVVALGNTPCWALLRATAISNLRGSTAYSGWAGPRVKVLPTYHPAAVLYQWSWRTIVVADLMKAFREGGFSEIRRPQRQVLINPTIEEVENYCAAICISADLSPVSIEIGVDCETAIGQIEMISFATSKAQAIVIPFIDKRKPGYSYWERADLEELAWLAVKRVCEHKNVRIVGQNFIYDMQYLCPMTIQFSLVPEDTMMLHHSLYPEMKKSLGFLGSIYTDEQSWKMMRSQKSDTEKRDE